MKPFEESLIRLIDDATMLPLLIDSARRVASSVPELNAKNYSDEDLEQAVRGFRAMLREALDGSGSTTRELFLQTVIPAFTLQGESASAMVHGAASYLVMLASELMVRIEAEHRAEAITFLSSFAGAYVRDVCATCTAVAPGAK